jgi:hypothetical protein
MQPSQSPHCVRFELRIRDSAVAVQSPTVRSVSIELERTPAGVFTLQPVAVQSASGAIAARALSSRVVRLSCVG